MKHSDDSQFKFSVQKIWDLEASRRAEGGLPEETDLTGEIHPDIIHFNGWWYCTLKESKLSRLRLIRSVDGEAWQSVRIFSWGDAAIHFEGKLSVTPYGALMITSYIRGLRLCSHHAGTEDVRVNRGGAWTTSITWLSDDGVNWGQPFVCPSGYAEHTATTRFTTTWFRGVGYSIAHPTGNLYKTLDGKSWSVLTPDVWSSWVPPKLSDEILNTHDRNDWQQSQGMAPRRPHETTIAFDPLDGSACAISRAHPFFAIMGTATAPNYDDWQWQTTRVDWDGSGKLAPAAEKLGVQIGGPYLRYLSNGLLLAAGRADASTPDAPKGRLTLFIVDPQKAILKRWGNFDGFSHYPGIQEHNGELWIVCGKQQRIDSFAVYLLKAPLPSRLSGFARTAC